MDLKQPGNFLYLVGETKNELGGSHFALVNELKGGQVPQVDCERAKQTFQAIHQAIKNGLVSSCHDLSEGGLAVAAAEMAFAGGYGLVLDLDPLSTSSALPDVVCLFSESNSRFLCEVAPSAAPQFESLGLHCAKLGTVTEDDGFVVRTESGRVLIQCSLADLKEAWQSPLRW